MRRAIPALAMLAAVQAHAGLFGNDAPGRIPVPARPFHAEVEDVGGVRTGLDKVSFDGEVYLFGTLGAAQVTVHFEDIDTVRFEPAADEDHRTAVVRTRAGDEVRIAVDHDRPVFGRTRFGNYRIEVADIRLIEF